MDRYTKILIPCNGANNSQIVPDLASARNWECLNGCTLVTAQSKFGGSSLQLQPLGGYLYNGGSDLLPITDLNVGANVDFTFEAWVRPTSVAAASQVVALFFGATYHPIYLIKHTAKWRVYMASSGAGSWDIANNVEIGDVTQDAWQHVAINRTGSDINGYVGGVKTDVATSDVALETIASINIGGYVGGQNFDGQVSHIRYSLGIGRYPAAFTAPAFPFKGPGDTVPKWRADRRWAW